MNMIRRRVLSLQVFLILFLVFVYALIENTNVYNKGDVHVHMVKTRTLNKVDRSTVTTGKGRLLCWIMTSPLTVVSKATHVQNTWGKRCDRILFMGSNGTQVKAKHLPVVELPVNEGREHLWQKTKEAFLHVHSSLLNDFDWFLKADDDTYVIVENLRHFLRDKDPNEAIYFGRRFKPYVKQGFMSGGAGYVLSRQSVRSLVEYGHSSTSYLNSKCEPTKFIGEDVQLGICLEMVGVKAGDTRDSEGKERFFPLRPEDHVVRGTIPDNSWYWSHIYYPHIQGCSRTAIAFHYITPNMMYAMDYLLYNLTLSTA